MAWLFRSDFDATTTAALWSIGAVFVATIVLFVYTMGLRVATLTAGKRRRAFLQRWRDVFALAMLSEADAAEQILPRVRRDQKIDLLEEWNRARSIVDGGAVANLIILAHRAGIPRLAHRLMRRRRVQSRILAAQTFGHLAEDEVRDDVLQLVYSDNIALSITAAIALTQIDAEFALSKIVPMIESRRDWPKNRVSALLNIAGSELISEPMYRAIRTAGDPGKAYLLQFARLVEAEVLDALVVDLLRSNNDPAVLNAALKLVTGFGGVPRIAALTQHKTWFVRMQAANVLGRVGQQEHLSLLEALLDDPEWWVRYRAAQAITSLPFLGPNQLRSIRHKQADRFAADILQQAFAEAGIA